MRERPSRFNSQAAEAHRAIERLASQFALTMVSSEEDTWGLTLLFQNSTTGLQLQYSPGEQDCWRAVLGRLVNGSFPKHPIHITQATDLQRFDLQDLATERVQEIPEYEEKVLSMAPLSVAELAEIASRSASDVLAGDFSVFSALRLRVLARAQAT